MTFWQFICLAIYALSNAIAQIVLKIASSKINFNQTKMEILADMIHNPLIWLGIAIYIALLISWVFIVSVVPVSKAFPVTMLALFFVPILSYLFLQEALTMQYFLGVSLIIGGALFIVVV